MIKPQIRYAYIYFHISYKQYYIHAQHICIKSLRHKLMTLYFITKDVISSRHIQQMSNIPTLPNMNRKWNTLLVICRCNILLYVMLQRIYSTFIPTLSFARQIHKWKVQSKHILLDRVNWIFFSKT